MSDTIQSAWSNDDLLDQLITRANQASIISESNDIRELRQLVLGRMERTARAEDAETVRAPGDWKDALAKKLASVAYNADMHTPGGYCLMLADFKTTLLDMQLALSSLSAGKVEPLACLFGSQKNPCPGADNCEDGVTACYEREEKEKGNV